MSISQDNVLLHNEEEFEIKPVGVRYKCEFCGKGEQIVAPTDPFKIEIDDAVLRSTPKVKMITHKCNVCGKEMQLPKAYPYIKWVVV